MTNYRNYILHIGADFKERVIDFIKNERSLPFCFLQSVVSTEKFGPYNSYEVDKKVICVSRVLEEEPLLCIQLFYGSNEDILNGFDEGQEYFVKKSELERQIANEKSICLTGYESILVLQELDCIPRGDNGHEELIMLGE